MPYREINECSAEFNFQALELDRAALNPRSATDQVD